MFVRVLSQLALIAALLPAGSVFAQHVSSRVIASDASGVRLEFAVSWPATLQADLDSAGVTSFGTQAALVASRGLFELAEGVELPHLGEASVALVERAYDEVRLPSGADADSVLALLEGPLVEAGATGISRRVSFATVRGRLLTYDSETEMLRRYRRLVVDVRYPARAMATARGPMARAADSTNPHVEVTRSALADGYLFKIPVQAEGVYRLDATYLNRLLEGVGLSVNSIDPASIKIFGNGGEPLPALNVTPRPADLVENPVRVTGTGSNLSISFFGRGVQGWQLDDAGTRWAHYTHPFSNENYYFLKIDPLHGDGARVQHVGTGPTSGAVVVERVLGRHVKEYDQVMWSKEGGSGLTWVSTQIDADQQIQIFSGTQLPGLAPGDVEYRVRVAVQSNQNPRTRVFFTSAGTTIGSASAPAVSSQTESPIAAASEQTFSQTLTGAGALNLTMSLERRPDDPRAALDWIRVFYPQDLRASDGYLRFATPLDATGPLELVLTGFSSQPAVWDVTEAGHITALPVTSAGTSYRAHIDVGAGGPREIVAFIDQALRTPEAGRRVQNQNLHGITSNPDFVIVTPDTFRVYAEELADYRRGDGLIVEVVDVQHIYNEFSGGVPDMRAVRDFFRFLYDRAASSGSGLRYALLFGDGHFDFRNLSGTRAELNNWIFPYETEESFHPVQSYTSDDYFGLLDDHEGVWPYVPNAGERVDIGIGRFTVQTPAEARTVVEKIKRYEMSDALGAWRMRYAFVADDGYNGLAGLRESTPDLHTQNIDVVANQVQGDKPSLNQKKIYGISYPRVFLAGWRQPEVRRDILAAINSGSLIVNYSGHGGPDGLAQERIFTREDAASLTNGDRMPLVITATCSFGRWDLANEQSGAEVLLLNDRGGAVAVLSTVRLVYTSSSINTLNVGLNLALNRALMEPDEDGLPRRLGDALRITKNTQAGLETNNRKFNLLGDPTMRLGLPQARAVVESVNGQTLVGEPVPVRALDKVTIRGRVTDTHGNLHEDFSGLVHLTVFDAERRVPIQDFVAIPAGYYTVREDLIWRGEVQADAGLFAATFVVPKDISYSNQTGKISAYALNERLHAGGHTNNIVVGGSSATPPDDSEGPRIALFLNDTTFVSGGLTNAVPELIVRLEDESGINTVGAGVGHELLLVVNGDEQRATNIGEHYQSEENSYQRGSVRFPFDIYLRQQNLEQLDPGPHSLEVRAWDVLNNSSSAALDFYVAPTEELALRNVLNFPNPLSRDTRFIFEHNKTPGTPARVQIRVYTLAGRPVRTLDHEETLPGGYLPGGQVDVYWDGRDEDFDPVGTGVYLYKVRVEVDGDGEKEVVERIEKLAVIR